jgi:heme/copper-type cytochrome/quinol oxidase subunit 2
MSVKVIGNQWYWTYEFDNWIDYNNNNKEINNITNDDLFNVNSNYELLNNNNWILDNESNIKTIYSNFSFNSVIKDLESLEIGEKRLLEVDNRLILSTNLTIRFLVTSTDVLHAFAVPELGFKVDAVPGRLNQILSFINRPGIYYGQCSELCGTNHGFMPIVIEGVLPKDFIKYIKKIENNLYN